MRDLKSVDIDDIIACAAAALARAFGRRRAARHQCLRIGVARGAASALAGGVAARALSGI
jgi:hypothetical protein